MHVAGGSTCFYPVVYSYVSCLPRKGSSLPAPQNILYFNDSLNANSRVVRPRAGVTIARDNYSCPAKDAHAQTLPVPGVGGTRASHRDRR